MIWLHSLRISLSLYLCAYRPPIPVCLCVCSPIRQRLLLNLVLDCVSVCVLCVGLGASSQHTDQDRYLNGWTIMAAKYSAG